eukprot:604489-Prorocentrum_minimum.AAC.1
MPALPVSDWSVMRICLRFLCLIGPVPAPLVSAKRRSKRNGGDSHSMILATIRASNVECSRMGPS